MKLETFIHLLACPVTKRSLSITELHNGDSKYDLISIPRRGTETEALGPTERVIAVEGRSTAFPVIEDFPVLLAPEMLINRCDENEWGTIDLQDPKYAEAYEEMKFYNTVGDEKIKSISAKTVNSIMGPLLSLHNDISSIADGFPEPAEIWIDARHDTLSQYQAYRYLAPINDKVFVQLGGSGSHAVKALLAGAKQAFLLTPMLGEARYAMRLAENFNVSHRLACVLGVGEELPFVSGSIDLVYSGGCFHHMRLDHVASELHRILRVGGRFSGVDPWKTPLHTLGTKVIGKRETSVYCKPITEERLAPIRAQFHDMIVCRHGPLLRYFLLALEKAGLKLSISTMMKVMRFDDLLGRPFRLTEKYGGSLVVAGTK